ncbi:[FeFe] hydrogenase H-cluster radical SAM maturase HydE [Candidatus Fermentibacteria bacterium]|nr:MAG: [FeFe] hydrogenase H-cluster radical SAM maturase HydE [Candidatus Fermentibacteria bacterium]
MAYLKPQPDEIPAIFQETPSRDMLAGLLKEKDPALIEAVRAQAEATVLHYCGRKVYYRGLVEFSNICALDCGYCGIRRSNTSVNRYTVSEDAIVDAARWCAGVRYGSMVLQSGERHDKNFISFVERLVRRIKKETVSSVLPSGLGITLCVGEHTRETYERFREAGAHRYLLRIETTDEDLFRSIHPEEQTLESRLRSLEYLRAAGFQVGTGVMIGLPGQTPEMLANDLLFYREHDFDMFGMGPFIPHKDTPMGDAEVLSDSERTHLGLMMIALTRLITKNTNVAATTALQALDPEGREKGLAFGANVLMPQLTPLEFRENYLLYENKPSVGRAREDSLQYLKERVEKAGRIVAEDQWGDSLHFTAGKT